MPVSKYRNILIMAVLCLFILPSCSSDETRFVMEGNFRNMNQVELYVFDSQKGTKDTIHVQRGRFKYERVMTDTTVLTIMFPNYSTLPVFAHGGISVMLKGDASHLRETKVTGSEENDDMTTLRLENNKLTPPEADKAAEAFITEHPTSLVSLYLLQTHFIQSVEPDYKKALRLCASMHKAQPANVSVAMLHKQLQELCKGHIGTRLPHFAVLDTKGKLRTNKDLRKELNIVCLVAVWNNESIDLLHRAQQLQREHKDSVALMAISIDATKRESYIMIRRDTIECPFICNGKMWQSELARKMGLNNLPLAIIADPQGKVLQRVTNTKALNDEIAKRLK